MSRFQRVRLVGGPAAGEYRHVEPGEMQREFNVYPRPSRWANKWWTVDDRTDFTKATYRRVDDKTWEFVRAPERSEGLP